MRKYIDLIESIDKQKPKFLYHGTTPYNAALIILSGKIEANESRDHDERGEYSTCTSEKEEVASQFYDVVRAVDAPFGFVFTIDTDSLPTNVEIAPFDAETASFDEYEWRIYDNVPISAVTQVSIVGYNGEDRSEIASYVREVVREYPYRGAKASQKAIVETIFKLINKSGT